MVIVRTDYILARSTGEAAIERTASTGRLLLPVRGIAELCGCFGCAHQRSVQAPSTGWLHAPVHPHAYVIGCTLCRTWDRVGKKWPCQCWQNVRQELAAL